MPLLKKEEEKSWCARCRRGKRRDAIVCMQGFEWRGSVDGRLGEVFWGRGSFRSSVRDLMGGDETGGEKKLALRRV